MIFTLGVIQLVCLILYVIPRTAVLGAILWTGYLGGAVAWGGLWLREQRLRALVPVR